MNFRSYFGENEFHISTSQEKNITIIHGENGVGKTAFLNAVMWVLFEKTTPGFKNPQVLLNHAAKHMGKATCWVEIEFEEDEREFSLRRTYTQSTKTSVVKLYEIKDSLYGPEKPNPEIFINTILPSEMADYFFFQGEGSSAVEGTNKKGTLAKSIRDILGFRISDSLDRSLKTLSQKIRRQKASFDKSGESSRIEGILTSIEKDIEKESERISDAQSILKVAKENLNEVDEELSKIKSNDLAGLRNREKELKSDLDKFKKEKISLNTDKLKLVRKFGWAVFGRDFAKESLDFIDESALKGRLPEPYNQSFINDILDDKACICGASLEPGSDGWKLITSMKEKAGNPLLQQRLTGIRAQIGDIKNLDDFAKESINRCIGDSVKCEDKIQQAKTDLLDVNEKIGLIPSEQISKLQARKKNALSEMNSQTLIIGGATRVLKEKQNSMDAHKVDLNKSSTNNKMIEALTIQDEFVQDMRNYLNDYLEKAEKDLRDYILGQVNTTLQKFSRNAYKVNFSGDYKIHLLNKNGDLAGQGEGLDLLLNLTITASLIKFVLARKDVKDSILSSTSVAPLIIDAPFGKLDENYRDVVIGQLPDYTRQIIFLVSSSQWTKRMEDIAIPKIGKEVCLIMKSTAETGPSDIINVRGVPLTLSEYACELDSVEIREVNI